ncbi:hypothetical protein ACFSTC_08795 [Nonomuraea ferruginea]
MPGTAVVGLLRDRDPLAALSVGAAASLVINVLLAQAMLLFDAWSPRAGVATVAVLGGFMYVLRVLYRGKNMQTEQGGQGKVKISVVRPRELGGPERARWRELQKADPSLDNPFLSVEFALAMDQLRDYVRVAVIENEDRIVGFFSL